MPKSIQLNKTTSKQLEPKYPKTLSVGHKRPQIFCLPSFSKKRQVDKCYCKTIKNGSQINFPDWIPQHMLTDIIKEFTHFDVLEPVLTQPKESLKAPLRRLNTKPSSGELSELQQKFQTIETREGISPHSLFSSHSSTSSFSEKGGKGKGTREFKVREDTKIVENQKRDTDSTTSIEDDLLTRQLISNVSNKIKQLGFDVDFDLFPIMKNIVKNQQNLTIEFLQDVFAVKDIDCTIGKYACFKAVLCMCNAQE